MVANPVVFHVLDGGCSGGSAYELTEQDLLHGGQVDSSVVPLITLGALVESFDCLCTLVSFDDVYSIEV